MRIAVLGSRGMLGQMAARYFSNRYEVSEFNHSYSYAMRSGFLDGLTSLRPEVVLNCIGRIKQISADSADLFSTNAVLPFDLSRSMGSGALVVHPSTDCVFDATSNIAYGRDQLPDAKDDYGWSKALGEYAINSGRGCVVRVSIVGPDCRSGAKGLLSWFLSQPDGSTVPGYRNHFWNGITTLEWCKQVERLLISPLATGRRQHPKLIQLGTTREYSKAEMLRLFNVVYGRQIGVSECDHEVRQYRCLRPDYESADLAQQLAELRSYARG